MEYYVVIHFKMRSARLSRNFSVKQKIAIKVLLTIFHNFLCLEMEVLITIRTDNIVRFDSIITGDKKTRK